MWWLFCFNNYNLIRFELEAALAESKTDIEAGCFIKETVAQHIQRIKEINKQTA